MGNSKFFPCKKIKSDLIEIEYIEDDNQNTYETVPTFDYDGETYRIDEFIRVKGEY